MHNPNFRHRLVLSAFFFVMGLIFACWAVRIPDIQAALGLNDAELGTALFGAPLGQLPCLLAAGFLVDRFGSRAILALGLFLYVFSLIALGLAGSFWQLFLALALFGIGGNIFDIALNTQAVAVEKAYGRSIMVSLHGLWSLGGAAGALGGALLANGGVAPAPHFLGAAVLVALLYCCLRGKLYADEAPERESRAGGRRLVRLMRPDPLIVILGVVAFGCMAAEGSMYDWLAVFFAKEVRPAPEFQRLGYIACMCAMVIGRFLADGLVARFGPIRVLQASGLFMCAGITLLILQESFVLAVCASTLVGFGMASGIPICYSLAGRSRRVSPSVAISLVVFISFSGFLLCPPLIGRLSHAFTLRVAFIPLALFSLAVCLLAPLLRREIRKASAAA